MHLSRLQSYAVSLLSVAAALALIRWLDFQLHAAPVSIFICAVMFSSWLGGSGPGLFSLVLSFFAFEYFFVAPTGSFVIDRAEIPRVVVFVLAAFFVAFLSAGQRRATEALRRSERRFRDYVDAASDWAWETGPDHAFTRFSDNIAASGIVTPARIGKRRWDNAADLDEEPEKWRAHRATLEAHQPFRHFTYRSRRDDGSVRYISASGMPMFDAHGRFLGYRGVGTDVTATVRAEKFEKALQESQAELAHVTRVTTLGEVTASVAHEVNQPLAAIVNNASACLALLPPDRRELDEIREALGDIVADAERASAIIRRVRGLATRSSSERSPLQLADVVADVVALAATEAVTRSVTIRAELSDDLPLVAGDRVQLQQVLLNLVVNGMDAMSSVEEGRRILEIRGRVEPRDGEPTATISVHDHGGGLDESQRERLFEAFFTTKPHGMGMGLAISRSIVEAHGGRLWAEPSDGTGATFCFSLPAVTPNMGTDA